MVLYDSVAGGAGHVRRLVTEDCNILQNVIGKAIAITKNCNCNPSCYNCLRNYYNQAVHDILTRVEAYRFLEEYYGNVSVLPDEMFEEHRERPKRVSNLCADRFKCYIEGGTCKDNGRYYEGCRNNKSLWTDSKVKRFPGTMYFGNESGSWGGKGVAFYTDAYKGETIMRLYKITWGQLLEVQRQEGSSSNWYGNILCLGIDEDGCPIYTLTSDSIRQKNAPSENYVKLISRALVEECGISEGDAAAYLSRCVANTR